LSNSAWARFEPIKPATPVIRIFFILSSIS
jgi:hypothetical protein